MKLLHDSIFSQQKGKKYHLYEALVHTNTDVLTKPAIVFNNTKYFYSLEKRHHNIKTVSKLKVGGNSYKEGQFEILEEENEEKKIMGHYTVPAISIPKISKIRCF